MSETTYPEYLLKSGWNALLPARVPNAPLKGDQSADVLVIGAGFTGLAFARRWYELASQDRIIVIDSSEIGEGNPGRNSGFLLEVALAEDADPANTGRMAECNRLTQIAMQSIADDVAACGEPVDCVRAGTYRAAAGDVGLRALNNYRQFLEAAGLPYRALQQQDLKTELGSEFYQAGLYSPDCYLVQPAAVIRAIAARVPADITLYENTPALKLQKETDGWRVTTPEGVIRAPKVILANNSFASNLGVARSRVTPVYTYAGLTPVLDDSTLEEMGDVQNWGILPCHRLGSTLRRTADGRLLIRSLHDYGREGNGEEIRMALQDRLWRRFPQVTGTDFEHVWGGAVGVTYNGAPVWGEWQKGLFVSAGCNGGGTVKGTLLGRLLAEMAAGQEVPDVSALFGKASWMPPEPFRAIGFHLQSGLESWQGQQEL
ncbi:MAG: FAD-binding oxidoreductase [Pseudomonadales bacterium]|nr:FAD-binding oxidoreductase [Pseudomonadales bacterium]